MEKQAKAEIKLFLITGILALLGGISQIIIGYFSSLALVSDAVHAVSDAGVDFVAVLIALIGFSFIRRLGNIFIGLSIVVLALGIVWEAGERFLTGSHFVAPVLMGIGGSIGAVIDYFRVKFLKNSAVQTSTKEAVLVHAITDFRKSLAVVALAVFSLALESVSMGKTVIYLDLGIAVALSLNMIYLSYFLIFKNVHKCSHTHAEHECEHNHCHHHHHY